jgi:hypothetical protein
MSADNLAMDTFLRSYMDEEGYLPIALLRNYPNVASCEAYYEYILDALSTSETFELDLPNETLRLKSKWEQVNMIYRLSSGIVHYVFVLVAHAERVWRIWLSEICSTAGDSAARTSI